TMKTSLRQTHPTEVAPIAGSGPPTDAVASVGSGAPAPRRSDIRQLAPGIEPSRAPTPLRDEGPAHLTPGRNGTDAPAARSALVTNYLNKTLVAAYKLVGFTLLTVILLGLCAYVALNGLFFLHDRWMAPAIIAPSDLRVIELRARLAHELWNRQKVEAELARVASDLKH